MKRLKKPVAMQILVEVEDSEADFFIKLLKMLCCVEKVKEIKPTEEGEVKVKGAKRKKQ